MEIQGLEWNGISQRRLSQVNGFHIQFYEGSSDEPVATTIVESLCNPHREDAVSTAIFCFDLSSL
jgi:hypothetical protein